MLKLAVDTIKILSEGEQIKKAIDEVTENIKQYNCESDLRILESLKELCYKNIKAVYLAKMHRNIGVYHFNRNNLDKAISAMQFSLDILRKENCTSLLVEYYSEIGLIHFYNHEYLYASKYYEEVEKLLTRTINLRQKVLYLHYYRYGILLSNMQEYKASKGKFERALEYAENNVNIGMTTMNIGLIYKRQKDVKTALRYYSRALYIIGNEDLNKKSIIYNNISEVYKILGQYKKALSYIEKAFNCIKDSDLSRLFIYFNTYTEIKILMGESECVVNEFFELLDRVEDFLLYKSLIIEGINNMAILASENEEILEKLKNTVVRLIENYKGDNREYVEELEACFNNIQNCLNDK